MAAEERTRISKVLSPNDLGLTGSHQSGICVPKSVIGFFPLLDPSVLNPDRWIEATGPDERSWLWRFVYYNNRLHSERGTRNEYRMTHIGAALKEMGAAVGHVLEFERTGEARYLVSVTAPEPARRHFIDLSGPAQWYVGSIPRR